MVYIGTASVLPSDSSPSHRSHCYMSMRIQRTLNFPLAQKKSKQTVGQLVFLMTAMVAAKPQHTGDLRAGDTLRIGFGKLQDWGFEQGKSELRPFNSALRNDKPLSLLAAESSPDNRIGKQTTGLDRAEGSDEFGLNAQSLCF